jgi:hypothetical protein
LAGPATSTVCSSEALPAALRASTCTSVVFAAKTKRKLSDAQRLPARHSSGDSLLSVDGRNSAIDGARSRLLLVLLQPQCQKAYVGSGAEDSTLTMLDERLPETPTSVTSERVTSVM